MVNEAKLYVQAGLDRRNAERKERIREGELDQYELDMIHRLNIHCADKKEEAAAEAKRKAREASRQAAQLKEWERQQKGIEAIRQYGMACVGILLLVGFTNFPGWAAATLALGLAEFPAIYIYRLYSPLGR